MTKQEYLNYGKEYLKLKGFRQQLAFGQDIKAKFPIAKFRIFKKWVIDVNQRESHRNSKQSEQWYIDRLESLLYPAKKATTQSAKIGNNNTKILKAKLKKSFKY